MTLLATNTVWRYMAKWSIPESATGASASVAILMAILGRFCILTWAHSPPSSIARFEG